MLFSPLFAIYQEGASEYNSTSGASVHCAAVNESHFSRAANDLHSSSNVHPLSDTSVSIDQVVIYQIWSVFKPREGMSLQMRNVLVIILFSTLFSPDCYLGKQMLQHIASWEETNACYRSSRILNKNHPTAMSNPPKTPLSVCLTTLLNNGPMQTPKSHKNVFWVISSYK